MNESFFQSQEFKRASSNVADSGVKLLFKWLGIALVGIVNTIKAILLSIIGK